MKFNRSILLAALTCCAAQVSVARAQAVPHFPIERFKIEGNSLLDQAIVDAAVASYIGPERDFGDVQRALEALEARYRDAGYSTVTVMLPEQVLDRGEVRLQVVEGRVGTVKVSGHTYFDEDNIRASLPTIRPGEVPKIDDVSANLRIANENPARKIGLQLQPANQEGVIDAVVQVRDERPWKLGATLDNTGTSQTGRSRLGLTLQHANLWNRDHVLTYQYQTSPQQPADVKVHALAYRVPLYGWGDALDLYATKSNVNAGTIAAGPIDLAISGSGTVFGARYTLNLKRLGAYEQQLVFGFDHKAFQNGIGAGNVQLGNDITVRPLSLQYNGRWQEGSSEAGVTASVMRNWPGGQNGEQADFDKARLGAPDNFTVWRGSLSASHSLASDWQLRFNSSAQFAQRPLVPGEQFGIGGGTSVRGFEEREVANDRGYQTSLEVYTPELCGALSGEQRCRALAFIDNGAVYRVKALPGEQAAEHIGSVGLGLRYAWSRHASLQADYGRVTQGGASQSPGDWKLHVRLGIYY